MTPGSSVTVMYKGTWVVSPGNEIAVAGDHRMEKIAEGDRTAYEGGQLTTVASFINVLFSLNLLLFIFNLLPIRPVKPRSLPAGTFPLREQPAEDILR